MIKKSLLLLSFNIIWEFLVLHFVYNSVCNPNGVASLHKKFE